MEETGKKAFPVQRVIELYKEEGIELTTQQAEQILEFSQKLINIVIQCRLLKALQPLISHIVFSFGLFIPGKSSSWS